LALQQITGGWSFADGKADQKDAKMTLKVKDVWGSDDVAREEMKLPKPDNQLYFDKLSSVYMTGTMHDEDSPNHLIVANTDVCRTVCQPEYKSPCNLFCPANVYEMLPSGKHQGQFELHVNYTNCIHCKTCDLKCPFENIEWTVPEGGGGPRYTET
jgi:electron-transferring-flavoprotein dehydrogenase